MQKWPQDPDIPPRSNPNYVQECIRWTLWKEILLRLRKTSFPLGVSQISNKDLKKIESKYMTPTKRQLGFRKTSSNAIFYGPRSKGAFELPSLIEFHQREHLRMLCGHLRANDHIGKAIINTISMLQLESGLTMPFLNTPYKYSQWVT